MVKGIMTMAESAFWTIDRFPVLYENGKPKAVLVDMMSFAQIELIIDNLLNREEEAEDSLLAASAALRQLVAQAKSIPLSTDWERELDELADMKRG